MNDDENNYDLRQLTLMMSRLDAFASGNLQLRSLIADLEALLGCLKGIDPSWKKAFWSEWSKLESASVDLGPGGHDALPTLHKNLIKGAVEQLRTLVQSRMDALSTSLSAGQEELFPKAVDSRADSSGCSNAVDEHDAVDQLL